MHGGGDGCGRRIGWLQQRRQRNHLAFVGRGRKRCGGAAPNAVVIAIASSNGPQAFAPNPAALQPGQQIVFRNVDSVAHHIVLDNGSLDTGLLATGQSSVAASVAASGAQYHCTIHPSMVGSINEPTATPPADPADPAY